MKLHTIENKLPVDVYCQMRIDCGLSPKTKKAAKKGLRKSLYTVLLSNHEIPVAMGRVIGDGGTACQVVDICVVPAFQRQGFGKAVMVHIMKFIQNELPKSCYISLIADGNAKHLYKKFGFKNTAPESIGMYMEIE